MEKTNTSNLEKRALEIAEKVVRGETTLQIELGLEDKEIESMYLVAYNLYMNGKYDEAKKCFGLLMTFSPMIYKYCFGLASCFQMLGEMEHAVLFYFLSTGLDQTQPAPFLHMAECLVKLDDAIGAMENLDKVLDLTDPGSVHDKIKNRAEIMLKHLKQQEAAPQGAG
jgi:type III secretion system low calcium response chaperone LcrH/SycD